MKNYSVVLAALFLPAAVFGANAAAQTVKPALKPAVKTTQTPAENLKFKFDCKVSKPDGIFKKGEEIVFTGKAADLNKEPKGKFFRAQLLFNGKLKERKIQN